MDTNPLHPEDMSNIFRFFRIPTDLYNKWSEYANAHNLEMKPALAELLHSVQNQQIIPYDHLNYPDIAEDWERTQPQMYKKHFIKQFHLKYPPELQKEIFRIFIDTGYKGQTVQMNKEICARLDYALKKETGNN